MTPLISVVIPTYNRSELLTKAIDSVLKQTIEDIEVLVVDDFSTDNTFEIVNGYKDKRVKYLKNKRKKGANGARNTGIVEAKGEYIAFQDSDDEWLEDKLEKQLMFMKANSDIDMCFCSFYRHDDENSITVPHKKIENVSSQLLEGNFISTQTIFTKAKCAKKVLFDEDLPRLQDWDFCLSFVKDYKIKHLNEPLVNVFVQGDSISKNFILYEEAIRSINSKYPIRLNTIKKSLYHEKALYYLDKKKYFLFMLYLVKSYSFGLLNKVNKARQIKFR